MSLRALARSGKAPAALILRLISPCSRSRLLVVRSRGQCASGNGTLTSRKIRKLTAVKFGSAPARRTIDRIFERHDLITKKRRRPGKPGHPGKPLTPMDEPNAVWTVDFKGQFQDAQRPIRLSPHHPGRLQPIPARVQRPVFHIDRARQACIHQELSVSSAYPPSSAPTTVRPSLPSASLASHG